MTMCAAPRLIYVLGILAASGCGTAAEADGPVTAANPNAAAIAIADDVRSECGRFMDEFRARRWSERKSPLTEGDIPDVEARLLDAIAVVIERFPTVESVSVIYGDRLLTGERRYASADDRRLGRRSRVGDMYAGPLRTLRYGDQLSDAQRTAAVSAKRGRKRLYVDVPVVEDNRYVCGLLITIRS